MKNLLKFLKDLDRGTVIRTLLQFLVYINQGVALFSELPISNSSVYQWITAIITILITAIGYWYNNDWTKAARMARDIFDMVKDGTITEEEVSAFKKYHDRYIQK